MSPHNYLLFIIWKLQYIPVKDSVLVSRYLIRGLHFRFPLRLIASQDQRTWLNLVFDPRVDEGKTDAFSKGAVMRK